MAEDNCRSAEESGAPEVERKLDRPSRSRDQRGAAKVKDKPVEDTRLPTPPPDPQCLPIARDRTGAMSRGAEEEEEDLATYLSELGASPFEGHSFDYDITPNSTTPAMGGDAVPFAEEAFEHLDRLCALTEQILDLRDRSSKFFRRVRGLERAKVQRNADRRLENALTNNEEELLRDFTDEDTGFAESLLDAILSNCRDATWTPRRGERLSVRSPSSSRQRSRSLALAEQNLASNQVERAAEAGDKRGTFVRNASRNGGPKISKWTRVKAAFKWERACTNDLADIAESRTSTTASSTPTTRYLRIPDAITVGNWNVGPTLSSCTSEVSSPSTPIGRVSSASSSNEEVFDDSRKNIVNYPDRQSPVAKDDRKKDDLDRPARSLDRDTLITESAGSVESSSEVNRSKPLIRIISDADATMHDASGGGRDSEVSPKRRTPILTITIPSNEEEIRSLSSPESISPLPSSTQNSGGSSPQHPKMRQDTSSPREFKQEFRQHSTIEEAVTQAPKIQRQDSKWNKVRRAFLTNATFSVPPSPVRMVAAQSFTNDDTRRARSCSESVEDLGKTVTGISSNYNNNNNNNHCRERETRRDYQALREKFGAEFHRKLVEWERLKSARNARDARLPLMNEERLAPEFRKKLQDWKRTKKGRRSGAAIEQQRVNRRRLTDWQLWRSSSSKPELGFYNKNQNSIGSRGSCASIGSAGSFGSDGKQHLCEDFIKRMEAWRRMSEAACRSSERPKSLTNRVTFDTIDETEFLALEKLLLLFGQRIRKERRESDARQLNDCFDGDSRFIARGVNCGNEVLIRTSVGSYRFEGISREFTRKLYDWEKYRGISPRSSTFRLLGPGYTPFTQNLDEATLTESPSTTGKNRAFHWTLKRSKSDGSVFEGSLRDESFRVRRSTSLQSLISTDKLEDDTRINSLPVSNNSQGIKEPSEDIAVEDSEPEAMIVDIEDVIEETASPLTGVQPRQTPVYSVAASETTSIAVPLGTVTSSHEPSPVFLVVAEDNENCKPWNGRKWIGPETRSSENSPSSEPGSLSEDWRKRATFLNEDKPSWQPPCEGDNKENQGSTGWTEKTRCSVPDLGDSVKSDQSIGWNRNTWDESRDEANRDSIALELSLTSIYEGKNDTKKQEPSFENGNPESAYFANNLETASTTWNAKELMDSPRTWTKEMNETGKMEDLADASSNNGQTSDTEDLQDDKNDQEIKKEKIILSTDIKPILDRHDSTETLSKLSKSNLDDNKDMSESCRNLNIENETSNYENCGSPELQTDVDRHYEILTFKTDIRVGDTTNNHLYEPVDCQEEVRDSSYDNKNTCVRESLLSSNLTATERSNLSETPKSLLTNSTVQTVPITVSRDSEGRCLEKILINEETLNKIIVPTMSAENGMKNTERIGNRFASMDRPDEVIGNRSSDRDPSTRITTRDNQTDYIKKDSSSSRNVFIKTKRMIFNPFRRSEDRASSRKESDGSIEGRLRCSSKSKSKSRSASPKLCRQDALLRVSLSLPWPLRSTSKNSEIPLEAESRRSSGSKTEDVVTIQHKNLPCEENSVNDKKINDRLTEEKSLSSIDVNEEKINRPDTKFFTAPINMCLLRTTSARVFDRSNRSRITSIEQDRCSQTQNDEERSKVKCNQMNFEGKQNDEERFSQNQDKWKQGEIEFGQKADEGRQQDESHAKCDAVSSDLMHKLRILSDAAARREGRATVTESLIISDPESRSSRIRRAKESFLSRRGGPFCRSMMEPTETSNPWRRTSVTSAQISTKTSKANEITMITAESEETRNAASQAEMASLIAQDEIASLSEDRVDACQGKDLAIDAGVRSESLVKSASAGIINVDPNTFGRLVTTDRGCESLPRTIAKRRDSSGPLAKIVGKLRLSRLIRTRNDDGGGMSTISTLCRQSLLIDMSGVSENRGSNEHESEKDTVIKDKDKDDDHSDESS
ncbi:microtubule-associated protein futsch [Polyergus mexicanus]|uniref:microtubule-associated protein futsch n=1 Tax=Polyergus mexicanus TaxID=615972 RepID=UPI0038B4BAB7